MSGRIFAKGGGGGGGKCLVKWRKQRQYYILCHALVRNDYYLLLCVFVPGPNNNSQLFCFYLYMIQTLVLLSFPVGDDQRKLSRNIYDFFLYCFFATSMYTQLLLARDLMLLFRSFILNKGDLCNNKRSNIPLDLLNKLREGSLLKSFSFPKKLVPNTT